MRESKIQPMLGMRLVGKTIEGDIVGLPILRFDDDITRKARFDIGTKIEFMEDMYNQVEELLSDGHIKHIMENLEKLQRLHEKYKNKMYERRMRVNEIEK